MGPHRRLRRWRTSAWLLAARRGTPPRAAPFGSASLPRPSCSCSSQLHTFNGLAAGTALLSLVAGLKLLETQSRRDLYVVSRSSFISCASRRCCAASPSGCSPICSASPGSRPRPCCVSRRAAPPPGWRRSLSLCGTRLSAGAAARTGFVAVLSALRHTLLAHADRRDRGAKRV